MNKRLLLPLFLLLPILPLALDAQEHRKPDSSYFEEEVIAEGLEDPMELDIAPDGRVFIIEREGGVKLHDPATETTREIARIPVVCHSQNATHPDDYAREDGLLGLALDPGFADNNWLYLYYSAADVSAARLSRFTYDADARQLDMESEKVLLEIPSDREDNTCHMGGSLAFDSEGHLFLSTGDNTNPFRSDGYAPIDDRPQSKVSDAQRTAGNTNDLRGKIIRIKPEDDGGYSIPEGNLFAPGTPHTRPEIYVMGNRNPFRISIDPRTGYLYWGEVGPDAGGPSSKGPMGHDEVNQARQPGNFGWPFFVANNKAYSHRDFATGELGEKHDADGPVNTGHRNTGLKKLPPAQPAFIWYPYGDSKEFPVVGSGGRNAMAGPVYYYEQGENDEVFPAYYDRTLFTYEWMRGKIFAVKLDEDSNYAGMEVFKEGLSHPVDLEFGPDGAMYLMEYGSGWYFNTDGRIRKIQFKGWNRRPKANILTDKEMAKTPTLVTFTGNKSTDEDGDDLSYAWRMAGDEKVLADTPVWSHQFKQPGKYTVALTVTDTGGKSHSTEKTLLLGNLPPKVKLQVAGVDDSTFEWGEPLRYKVWIDDSEDGTTNGGKIDGERVQLSAEYFPSGNVPGSDMDPALGGLNANHPGTRAMLASDCFACHQARAKSIGPSYFDVAQKYFDQEDASLLLADKVIKGGVGVWGHQPMAPHPLLKKTEALAMVEAILALAKKNATVTKGDEGTITLMDIPAKPSERKGAYLIRASYTDIGLPGLGSFTTEDRIVLNAPLEDILKGATLLVTDAQLNGDGAQYNGDVLGSWADNGTYPSWRARLSKPAKFKVIVRQSRESGTNGKYDLQVGDQRLTGTVQATGNWDTYQDFEIGEVAVRGTGPLEVSLRPRPDCPEHVMNLKAVILQPVP